jgi:hypothetical protein
MILNAAKAAEGRPIGSRTSEYAQRDQRSECVAVCRQRSIEGARAVSAARDKMQKSDWGLRWADGVGLFTAGSTCERPSRFYRWIRVSESRRKRDKIHCRMSGHISILALQSAPHISQELIDLLRSLTCRLLYERPRLVENDITVIRIQNDQDDR